MLTARFTIILLFVTILAPVNKVLSQSLTPFNTNITAVKTYSGLHVAAFNVKNGQLKIYLPDDMAISDTVSGSVNFEFYELGKGELVNRQFDISDYSLNIEHKHIDLEGENFKFVVPYNLPAGVLNVELHDKKGDLISRAFFPVRLTKQNQYAKNIVDPSNFRIPAAGRSGLPVEISGPFDGDYSTTKMSVAGRSVRMLAESPRKLVFESPEDVNGTRVIAIRERDVDIKNTFTNLNVVHVGKDQSYYRSSIKNDSKSSEQIRRGEFIIESDEIDQPISKWKKVPVPEDAGASTTEVSQKEKVTSAAKSEGNAKDSSSNEEFENSQKYDRSSSVSEKITDENGSVTMETDSDNSTKSDENEKKASEPNTADNTIDINSISGYLERQYEARVSASSSDLVRNQTQERKVNRSSDMIRSESYKKIKTADEQEKQNSPAKEYNLERKTGTKSGYALQLASVKNKKDADKLVEKIKLKGYNAYSVRTMIPGKGHWFRIRIGGFSSRQEAMNYKSSMQLDGLNLDPGSFFVTEGE